MLSFVLFSPEKDNHYSDLSYHRSFFCFWTSYKGNHVEYTFLIWFLSSLSYVRFSRVVVSTCNLFFLLLWFNYLNIPQFICSAVYEFLVPCTFQLLWIKFPWTLLYMSFGGVKHSFILAIPPVWVGFVCFLLWSDL